MKAYRAAREGRAGWRLSFKYDEQVVEQLKGHVPPHSRAWYPEEREWWVEAEYEQEVLELLPEFEEFLRQAPLPGMA